MTYEPVHCKATTTGSTDANRNLLCQKANAACQIYLSQTGNGVSQSTRPLAQSIRGNWKEKSSTVESGRRGRLDTIVLGKLSSGDCGQCWPLRRRDR